MRAFAEERKIVVIGYLPFFVYAGNLSGFSLFDLLATPGQPSDKIGERLLVVVRNLAPAV